MITLRDYQEKDVFALGQAWSKGYRRLLYVLPTGGGKTRTFTHVIHSMVMMGQSVLVLCHRREILDQISATLTIGEVEHGVLFAGMDTPDSNVIVGSIQTVDKRDIPEPGFIVVDEFHHAASATFTKVLSRYPKARVLGVTATPERLDGKGLSPYVDHMHIGPSAEWLMQNGYLARPEYWAPSTPDVNGLKKRGGDYKQEDTEALMDKREITGNVVKEYVKHANGLQAIAFCCTVKHAESVAEVFTECGYPAECIHGGTKDRKEMMERFRCGQTRVLTNCELIGEGVDVPSVGAAILIRPTASLTLHLQQIGRALRPKPDGSKAVIIDHAGNLMRHGGAEEHRDWKLEGKAAKRRVAGQGLKQCPVCYRVYVEPTCPCGHKPEVKPREIKQTAGELAEWKAGQRRQERECRTLADFVALGKQRGYHPRWAHFRWNARKHH